MRVLITRPPSQANEFAQALQAIGAEPVFLPVIQVSAITDTTILDRALARLHCYDWLVLTSANAVDVLLDRMRGNNIHALPAEIRVAAVGPKTASRLEENGIHVAFVPQEFVGEAIVPGLGDLRGRWVLLPTADIASPVLPKAIEAAGGVVHVITAYHTLPAEVDQEGLAALLQGIDVLTFTSGSTARNFNLMVQQAGLNPFALPGDPLVACIGPKTAQVAQELGFNVEIIAEDYTIVGLVAAIKTKMIRTSR
jgi:uroporphyrinogen-III synthase